MIFIVDYNTKKDALYIKCVVLANGETNPELYKDSQGDVWDGKTIKQVYTTEANQTEHDLFHNKQKVDGVTTISNYISTEDKKIAGRTVPAGSWLKELMITDENIIQMIKSNQINGVSPNHRLHVNSSCAKEAKHIKDNIFYNSDIQDKECMKPVFLSLVDSPANGYGLEVYSYDKYLAKSKVGGRSMSNKLKEMLKGFGESIVNYAEGIDENPKENRAEETETGKEEMKKADETKDQHPEENEDKQDTNDLKQQFKELSQTLEEQSMMIKELAQRVEALESPDKNDEKDDNIPESQKSTQPRIKVNNEKLDSAEMNKNNNEKTNHLGMPIKTTKELAKSRNSFNF